jgi:hypothetical protein
VGSYPSIALGADGRGIIAYLSHSDQMVKVGHCSNQACGAVTGVPIAPYGVTADSTSIAVGPDGLPLVAFYDDVNQDLKVAHLSSPLGLPNVRSR